MANGGQSNETAMGKTIEIEGQFRNSTGNICKVVKVTKIKQGRSKSINQVTCEVTEGTTTKAGLIFTQTETLFTNDWKPVKNKDNGKTK